MINAIAVVQKVAVTSGMTPKDASANRGAHLVPNKKSVIGTSAKNCTAGMISAVTIPIVMAIVSPAATRSPIFATASPGRRADVVSDGRRRGGAERELTDRSVTGACGADAALVAVGMSTAVRRR